MFIAPNNDFSFIHMNKTGGRSAIRFMEMHLRNFYSLGAPFVHRPLKSVILMAMGSRLLTICRNPYNRYESLYSYRKMKYSLGKTGAGNQYAHSLSFVAWMWRILRSNSYTELPQSELLEPWPNNLTVVRLEHIQKELPEFLELDCSLFTVPHLNPSPRQPIEWTTSLQREVWDREERIFTKYYPEEERP